MSQMKKTYTLLESTWDLHKIFRSDIENLKDILVQRVQKEWPRLTNAQARRLVEDFVEMKFHETDLTLNMGARSDP